MGFKYWSNQSTLTVILLNPSLMNFVNQFHPISICQACVARGADDEDLMRSTQSLTKAIADYKVAAKTVKGLESQSRCLTF